MTSTLLRRWLATATLAFTCALGAIGCQQSIAVPVPDEKADKEKPKEKPTAEGQVRTDWPQWRGPDRNGNSKEKGLLKTWPKEGPTLVWTFKNAGYGYSGPAVLGGKVYTIGARDGKEFIIALDEKGKERWSAPVGKALENQWNAGPSTTPSVDDGLVYAIGSMGDLVCVDTDGKEKWRKNLPKDLGGEIDLTPPGGDEKLGWGYAGSPLVDGKQLICTPGGPQGLLAALDKKSGAVLWRSKEVKAPATYASPVAADVAGVRQYISMTTEGVVGIAAEDGKQLWYFKRENPFPDVVCPTPVVKDNKVYATAGWNGGCTLLKLTPDGKKFKVEEVYSDANKKNLGNRVGGVVLVDDLIFGSNETGPLCCQDFATGAIKWTSGRKWNEAGAVTYADGFLYCQGERPGTIALIEATGKGFTEVSRFKLPEESKLRTAGDNKIPSARLWTPPVISDGHLYLRDQELIFCFKIK
jgi:outer membrane protein assembly factor BamB